MGTLLSSGSNNATKPIDYYGNSKHLVRNISTFICQVCFAAVDWLVRPYNCNAFELDIYMFVHTSGC